MQNGNAPLGHDGLEINLHHLTQDESGPMPKYQVRSIVKTIVPFICIQISGIKRGLVLTE
ncbi:HNH/ENDO VII family nuclease [Pectobacterium parmentieri]